MAHPEVLSKVGNFGKERHDSISTSSPSKHQPKPRSMADYLATDSRSRPHTQ